MKIHNRKNYQKAFSLVEMLVVVSIMVVLALLTLIQNNSSRSGLELTNLAYGVALFVREAQSYGIAVRQEDVGVGSFDLGYGVFLDKTVPSKIVMFKDLNKDGLYAGADTILKELTFGNIYSMNRFCGVTAGGVETCSTMAGLGTMAITFVRPNPDAQIKGLPTATTYSVAKIYLRAPNGTERLVSIYATGQIGVSNP